MASDLALILDLQKTAIENNLDCLSIYKSFENWSKNVIQTELQNQIKGAIREYSATLDGNKINTVAENIISQIIDLPYYKKSIAIFTTLDLANIENYKFILNKNLFVIFSDEQVSDRGICGKVFSFTSLNKMIQYSSDTMCIYISKKETKFYELNSEFRLLNNLENVILEKYEDRFVSKTPGSGFLHGGSADDEKKLKFAKKILNDAFMNLKTIAKSQNQYKMIIVYHTDEFASFTDFIENEVKYFSDMKPHIEKKVFDTETNLEIEFKNARKNHFEKFTNEKLEKYKTSIDGTFKIDLDEISESVRDAKVHKLYISEDFNITGWILTKEFPYLSRVDGSQETDQLVDWMILKVLNTGGEVYILPKENIVGREIAAKLRY